MLRLGEMLGVISVCQGLLDDRTSMLYTEMMDDDMLLDDSLPDHEEYQRTAPADMGVIREWFQTRHLEDRGAMSITDKRDCMLEILCLIEYAYYSMLMLLVYVSFHVGLD